MDISAHTLETLQNLASQDATLLEKLYATRSLEQAVNIVAESACQLGVALDRGELTHYLRHALTTHVAAE